jgi:hypothetical protein
METDTDGENSKILVFQTAKHKLKTVIKPEHYEEFKNILNPLVCSFSRFAHEVTIFANLFISWVLENPSFEVPLINREFYEHCIKAVQQRPTKLSPAITHFVQSNEWEGHMNCKELKGFSIILQTLAVKLTTNGKNHLWMYFRQRQFQALRLQTKNHKQLQNALWAKKDPSEMKFEDDNDTQIYKEHFNILFQKRIRVVREKRV